uniref:Uncharacterized protein n=1 Tax=Streptomyces sp. NBC_00180 TaxID=2903632 RepID=A0AAU1HQG2_9ACTN
MSARTAPQVGPVTLICHPDDTAAWPCSVLAASSPATGCVAVDNVPGSSAALRPAQPALLAHADVAEPDHPTPGQAALLPASLSGHRAVARSRVPLPLSPPVLAELTERRLLDARSTPRAPVLHPDLLFAAALPKTRACAGRPA